MSKQEGLVRGYNVIRAVYLKDGAGYALGKKRKAPFTFAIWQFSEHKSLRKYQNGQFFKVEKADTAELVYNQKIAEYRQAHPELNEKYNPLAAAEMSGEQNYNQIDGIANNGFDSKPSIIDQLREYKPKPPAKAGGHEMPKRSKKQPDIDL